MRLLTPLAVFVVAILTTVGRSEAEDKSVPAESTSTVSSSAEICPPDINGFDQFRQSADIGSPGSPGYGFKHFPSPMHAFTRWHRPRAATLTACQRCEPDSWRPRGFGNLFARPCDPFRMDYSPHTLNDGHTKYGPAYILRMRDPRCEDCSH